MTEADQELTDAVDRYLHRAGLIFDDSDQTGLTLTDVMLVTVRCGFDQLGSKSQTSVITPTDSSVPILIGMARYASIRFESMAEGSFPKEGG